MGSMQPLIDGLRRTRERSLDGARDALRDEAAAIAREMRASPAHGDQTGATHANYAAYVVGRGETGADALAEAVAAVEALNPGRSATAAVTIGGALGVVITSATDYQQHLEIGRGGEKAVLTPTTAASGARLTRAAAAGSKKALR